jgi:predicted  nucleic acid-binding Zn-ribbon protein
MATIAEKIKAQAAYHRRTGNPAFAPSDGICWACHRQIYDRISLETASTELITGCPFCNRSYCS